MNCDDLEGWVWREEREAQEGTDVCITVAGLPGCMARTNTALLRNFPPIKEQILKKENKEMRFPSVSWLTYLEQGRV